ncbi:hypothetical protein ACKKBF_B40205 [Auxenochlorella protothecoides x Auxenochlorella symbiontica]
MYATARRPAFALFLLIHSLATLTEAACPSTFFPLPVAIYGPHLYFVEVASANAFCRKQGFSKAGSFRDSTLEIMGLSVSAVSIEPFKVLLPRSTQIILTVECLKPGQTACKADSKGNIGTGNDGKNNFGDYNIGDNNIDTTSSHQATTTSLHQVTTSFHQVATSLHQATTSPHQVATTTIFQVTTTTIHQVTISCQQAAASPTCCATPTSTLPTSQSPSHQLSPSQLPPSQPTSCLASSQPTSSQPPAAIPTP